MNIFDFTENWEIKINQLRLSKMKAPLVFWLAEENSREIPVLRCFLSGILWTKTGISGNPKNPGNCNPI